MLSICTNIEESRVGHGNGACTEIWCARYDVLPCSYRRDGHYIMRRKYGGAVGALTSIADGDE